MKISEEKRKLLFFFFFFFHTYECQSTHWLILHFICFCFVFWGFFLLLFFLFVCLFVLGVCLFCVCVFVARVFGLKYMYMYLYYNRKSYHSLFQAVCLSHSHLSGGTSSVSFRGFCFALREHLRTHIAMMCLHNSISYFIHFTDRFHGKSYNIL